MRRPYYKQSHKAWYVNLNGRPVRLASLSEGEEAAWNRFNALTQPVDKVVEVVRRFLTHHNANSAPATHRFYSKALDAFCRHIAPTTRVADLRPYHVTQWIDAWKKPIGSNYKRNLIRAVKTCFRWAEDQEYIERSPLRKLKVPPATARGDETYLTPEQWEKLANYVGHGCLFDLIAVMREVGCRPQEIRRVEARHFDREGRCWVFPKSESKGKREPRIVHLTDCAHHICQRLALKYHEGPIFRNGGQPWTAGILDYHLQRLSQKVGFRVTPYSIRHTFATDAIIRGVDLQTIATLMGHSDLKMLSKVYQHIRRRSDHIKEGLRKATGEVA
jgi:integrase